MPLRPIDTDLLSDICTSVASGNYGFLYVDQTNDEIRSQYESADNSPLKASSLSPTDIKKTLEEMASDDYSELERLRTGVYYYNPFGTNDSEEIIDELKALFRQPLVVTSEDLRSQFDLAIDDVSFFADELVDRNLVRRIATGERDYYTIGQQLKEEVDEGGVNPLLDRKADRGKLTHDQLERVINVSATSDVIRYLESEGFIIDLDGEYLFWEAYEEYAAHLADGIEEAVTEEFEKSGYVLPNSEYETVVKNEIDSRFDVLGKLRSRRDELLSAVYSTLSKSLDLNTVDDVVVQESEFQSMVEERAEQLLWNANDRLDQNVGREAFVDEVDDDLETLQLSNSQRANEFIRHRISESADEQLEEKF